ncbi:hypothetical protein D3C75_1277700 [compost metagenome]
MTGITNRIVDAVGQHRSDQLAVEETQRAQGIDFKGRRNATAGEHILMTGQLRFEEVIELVIGRLQRHLIDA